MQAAMADNIEAVNNWRVTEKNDYCMTETKLEGSVWTFLREFERITVLCSFSTKMQVTFMLIKILEDLKIMIHMQNK